MPVKLSTLLATTVAVALLPISSHAVPISDPAALDPAATIYDFEGLPLGAADPLALPGVTISDDNGSVTSGIISQGFTQYPGIFEGQYYGFGQGDRGFILTFDDTVSQFGMGIFDPNFTGNVLRALDVNGNELERITSNIDAEFPVGAPGGGFSTFAGFVRASADIKTIELLHVAGDFLSIDNVTFLAGPSVSVPEPGTLGLLSLGLISLSLARRKRSAQQFTEKY